MDAINVACPKLAGALTRVGVGFPEYLAKTFPRILERVEQLWGDREAINYLDSLLLEDRENRQGFPLECIREIAQIKQAHDFLFPSLDSTPFDPFSGSAIVAPAAQQAEDSIPFEMPVRQERVRPAGNQKQSTQVERKTQIPERQGRRGREDWPVQTDLHQLYELADLRKKRKSIYPLQGRPIGEIFVYYGMVDEQSLRVISNMQDRGGHAGKPLGQLMIEIGVINQEDLNRALCIQTGVIMVDVLSITVPPDVQNLVTIEKAREMQVMPVGNYHGTLFLACGNPFEFAEAPFFTVLTGYRVELVYAPRNEIINRLNLHGSVRNLREAKAEFHDLAQKTFDSMPTTVEERRTSAEVSENDATIINLVNQLIRNAISEGISDIHIEQFQGSVETEIRFRRDGRLENFSTFPRAYHQAVVSRIKIMAGLDISERRRPQDGKISFGNMEGKGHADLRVSVIPTIRGVEFVTIRILVSGEPLPLAELGLTSRDMDAFSEMFHRTFGLILVCGPTGSGKTTTLHSVMKDLNISENKIWTIEDPVEIVQPHLCQVQVNNRIGVTFANILRSFLRADPDIIMIGEMRDQETAKIALEASMTGHLVLSTLHTNSASETVARLIELEIDPYNLSDALLAILAQRLVRKLCPSCARRELASPADLEELANEYYLSSHDRLPAHLERENLVNGWIEAYGKNGELYLSHPVGCKACNEGYKGRIGIYELLQATPQIRHLIRHRVSASKYKETGIAEGMRTLKQDGIEKVVRGITDLAQVHIACA